MKISDEEIDRIKQEYSEFKKTTELREPMTFIYNLKNNGEKIVPLYIASIKLSYDLTSEKEWSDFRKNLKNVIIKLFPN